MFTFLNHSHFTQLSYFFITFGQSGLVLYEPATNQHSLPFLDLKAGQSFLTSSSHFMNSQQFWGSICNTRQILMPVLIRNGARTAFARTDCLYHPPLLLRSMGRTRICYFELFGFVLLALIASCVKAPASKPGYPGFFHFPRRCYVALVRLRHRRINMVDAA